MMYNISNEDYSIVESANVEFYGVKLKTGKCSFLFLKNKSSINPIIIKPIGKWTNSGWNLPIRS